jgi:hypothetical protein
MFCISCGLHGHQGSKPLRFEEMAAPLKDIEDLVDVLDFVDKVEEISESLDIQAIECE